MIKIRPAVPADAANCGRILFEAFAAIGDQHRFPHDFPSIEVATQAAAALLVAPGIFGIVAERDGPVVGSNFVDQRSRIAGIGPVSVDAAEQNSGVGRALMQAILEHVTARNHAGIRLVQSAYHNRSLSLYTRLGFAAREPLSVMQGTPLAAHFAGYAVRAATEADLPACNRLCERIHGFDRGGELAAAIHERAATVVEHLERIAGYATGIGYFAHAVAEDNQSLKALIAAAPAFTGLGFLVPTRNYDLFRWCLDHRLRLVQQMTLMSIGLYNEPGGAYLPSILY